MKKLAIITTHPIQYNAPWFKLLAQRGKLAVRVFYTWGHVENKEKYDPGFGKNVEWDIPLLDGYEYTFVKNISTHSGSHHFKGIVNPTLINELEEWEPDAILVFGWSFKSHLKVLRHFKGKKTLLFRGDSNLLDEAEGFSIKKTFRRWFLKWVYSHVDKALYVGTANKKYFLLHGLKEHQLVFAPHAIDNHRFFEKRSDVLRLQLNLPMGDLLFLYAGKFEPTKNLSFLLETFISACIKNAHLILIGNGILESGLKERCKYLDTGLQQYIHFMDFQNQANMPAIYQGCNVFILPSRGETWGLVVNEAMASGKAVLVSDKCGCAADLVKDGINGYVFKNNNREDLVNKIKLLITDKVSIAAMGNASREIIKDWSFEKICDAIEQTMNHQP